MKKVTLYTKENCCLCDEAKELLEMLKDEHDFTIIEKDIYQDEDLLERYQIEIPVVVVDGEELNWEQIDLFSLKKRLQ